MKQYESYKNSGVEWIGDIPENWEVRKLKFSAKINLSNVDKKTIGGEKEIYLCNYVDVYYNNEITSEIKFMKASATKEQINKFILEKGDVLITKDSESPDDIAVPSYVAESFDNVVCGYHLAHIKEKKILGKFLFYSFLTDKLKDQFSISSNGITRYGLGKSGLGNSIFFIPPTQEQQKIASFLDDKTQKIEQFIKNKQRLIELLEEEKKTLITHAVTKGINPDVSYKNSGVEWIGDIPEHWKVSRTKNLFRLIVEPAKKNNDHELLSIYTDIGVKPRKELAEKGNKASTTDGYWKVKKGDFIINKLLAWMGAVGLSEYEGVTSPAYDILRKKIELNEYYYNALFRCGVILQEFKRYSKGIMEMRLRLYFDEFGQIFLPIPPIEEQQQIVSYIEEKSQQIDGLKAKYQQEIDLINEYKERLIYDVVTGKINVQETA